MRKWFAALIAVCLALVLAGCGSADQTSDSALVETQTEQEEQEPVNEQESSFPEEKPAATQEAADVAQLALFIDDEVLDVSWEDNDAVSALIELAKKSPLEIQMSMYGGFEQVGSIGTDLPRNDEQTITQTGDIVLYQGNQIVVFYGSNSWSYTRLGHIEGKTAEELEQLLGERDVTLTLEVT